MKEVLILASWRFKKSMVTHMSGPQVENAQPLLEASMFDLLSNALRFWAPILLEHHRTCGVDSGHYVSEAMLTGFATWSDKLAVHLRSVSAQGIVRARGRQGYSYKPAFLIRSLMLASLVQCDSKLQEVVRHSLDLTLLPSSLQGLQSDGSSQPLQITLPSKSKLSKARLLLDASWCMLWRNHFLSGARSKSEGDVCLPALFLLADSSPQLGADWFIAEASHLHPQANKREFFELVIALANGCGKELEAVQRQWRIEASSKLQSLLKKHCFIPTALGSARASAQHKLQCLLHTLHLDLHSWANVRAVCERIVSFTSDFGIEALLPSASLPLHSDAHPEVGCVPLLGHWQDAPDVLIPSQCWPSTHAMVDQHREAP